MPLTRAVLPLCMGLVLTTATLAGPAADATIEHLYGGTVAAGLEALTPMAEGGDAEARFGLGMLRLVGTVEGFAQALYRHGLAAPRTGPLGPVLSIPLPENPAPETLTYDGFRLMLEELVSGLDAAKADFIAAGEAGDYVVSIDPMRIRIDVNGDGRADDAETVAAVVGSVLGDPTLLVPPESMPPLPEPVPGEPAEPKAAKGERDGRDAGPPSTVIGFDRADAIWLAGYSNIFGLQAEFFLAHDFSNVFDAGFHRLFPRAGLPMQEYSRGGQLMLDPESDAAIADVVAVIHTLSWPVESPYRLRNVLARMQEITQLSRRNWEAILAETDDNNELLPSPSQTGVAGREVTAQMIDAWHETLDTLDAILAGDLLLPHWRFRQGIDLNAYFTTATRTDLVMLLTGHDAVPYLKDGPIADPESFAAGNRVFGSDFLGFAAWFN